MAKIDDYIAEVAEQFPNPIVNDGGVDRPMDDAEKRAWYLFSAERRIAAENEIVQNEQKDAAKKALLGKLGITEEEAKLLLG